MTGSFKEVWSYITGACYQSSELPSLQISEVYNIALRPETFGMFLCKQNNLLKLVFGSVNLCHIVDKMGHAVDDALNVSHWHNNIQWCPKIETTSENTYTTIFFP